MKKNKIFRALKGMSGILLFALLLCNASPMKTEAKSYSRYSSRKLEWGLGQNKSHKSPAGNTRASVLKKYDAYYLGSHSKKDKVMYLSFDCGYENGYTKKILDVLKKQDVKAIFFVTESYIKDNPKLVKRMKKEGHLVGNHTSTHPDLSGKSEKRIRKEIRSCEKTMKKLTGYEIDRYLRPPMGCYSMRSMKITQDLGYTTIFWSMALYDYDVKHQPGKSYVVNYFNTYHHNGAIPLLHVISKSDTQALNTVIRNMKKKGYRFGMLSEMSKDKI